MIPVWRLLAFRGTDCRNVNISPDGDSRSGPSIFSPTRLLYTATRSMSLMKASP